MVYTRESKGHLLGLSSLASWKSYLEKENTWEPYSAVQHLKKLFCLFYKDHSDKLTANSEAINIVPLMARPTIKSAAKLATKPTKQKQSRPANYFNKQAKKSWAEFDLLFYFLDNGKKFPSWGYQLLCLIQYLFLKFIYKVSFFFLSYLLDEKIFLLTILANY